MRRNDREVTDFNEIVDILKRADTLHLGIFGEEFPYVVPLSYGFESSDGKIVFYVHGAAEGKKHDLISADSRICAEVSIFHRYAKTARSITCEYESVIGYGRAERVYDNEAEHGIALLVSHCGYEGYDCPTKTLSHMTIYKITLESFTGKRRFVD